MVLRSGNYTGTGSTQTINVSDLGGTPNLVIIINENGNNGNFKTSAMNSGDSIQLGTDTAPITTGITSFANNQFTIGTDGSVNQNGTKYHYLVVRDDGSSDFKVGTYTGNGGASQAITGFGFTPNLVINRRGSPSVVGKYDTYRDTGASNSGRFDTAQSLANRINSLDADGFTAGSDTDANDNTVPYYYVGFKNVTGKVKITTYTGNGSSQSITGVGFKPDWVNLFDRSTNQISAIASRTMGANNTSSVRTNTATTGIITSLDSDGFSVGSSAQSNTNTDVYTYLALLAPAPSGNVVVSDSGYSFMM